MSIQKVRVDLRERGYDIVIGAGVLRDLSALVPEPLRAARSFVISDEQVAGLYGESVCAQLPQAEMLGVAAGEASKSFAVYQRCAEQLLARGLKRSSVIYALGGGVVGDLAGFLAATVMRGVPFVQIPTSLLAMVDSSVGGKTGINTVSGKNLLGAFYQPRLVVCDTDMLKTLPVRERAAGMAEIIKYGLIGDANLFNLIDLGRFEIPDLIARSCAMKAQIVGQDEREEGGARATLNFGHTFGHAFEAMAGYDGRLLHGEAVGIGMVYACALSERLCGLPTDVRMRLVDILRAHGLPHRSADLRTLFDFDAARLVQLMRGDKKADDKGLSFVVLDALGTARQVRGVAADDVLAVLNDPAI